ncbi:hypothetical protein EVAR_83360_1 [Eumeta japonica]|uniref:Uncharacterized protein n=1 Tax=Eumeta variegata TaxID=151549 RepID=A0A4C1TYP2_EUMVA|nr:hypothetical protein EVAR_83360_1 [Eumeta japonica]
MTPEVAKRLEATVKDILSPRISQIGSSLKANILVKTNTPDSLSISMETVYLGPVAVVHAQPDPPESVFRRGELGKRDNFQSLMN